MLRFTLTWTMEANPLCPSCLEELSDAAFCFCDNIAFCPSCASDHFARIRDDCLRIINHSFPQHHFTTFRGLDFFTPRRLPKLPIQLVRPDGPDAWLLDFAPSCPPPRLWSICPDIPPPAVDDNPGPGTPLLETSPKGTC